MLVVYGWRIQLGNRIFMGKFNYWIIVTTLPVAGISKRSGDYYQLICDGQKCIPYSRLLNDSSKIGRTWSQEFEGLPKAIASKRIAKFGVDIPSFLIHVIPFFLFLFQVMA